MSKFFVPSEIIRVFKDAYPDIHMDEVEWSWEVPGKVYEAEFESDEKSYEVEITVTGHHLLTEVEIEYNDVPKNVKNTVAEAYADHAVDGSSLVVYSTGDIFYELELVCAEKGTEFEVLVREDGWILAQGEDL